MLHTPLLFVLAFIFTLTGCASKEAPKPSVSPSETTDSELNQISPSPKVSEPTSTPSSSPTSKTPTKPAISESKSPKNTPKPTTSPSPKTIQFGVPLPWESTPPDKLATPWTLIPPAATTETIAIVRLNPQSILIAVERALFRRASVYTGILDFRIEPGKYSDLIWVTCPNGTEKAIAYFAAQRTWNLTYHPSTYTLLPLDKPSDPCASAPIIGN